MKNVGIQFTVLKKNRKERLNLYGATKGNESCCNGDQGCCGS